MNGDEIIALINAANKRIWEMDKIDIQNGTTFPIPLSVAIGNAREAVMAGIRNKDWDCVADAFVMLTQINNPAKVRWGAR